MKKEDFIALGLDEELATKAAEASQEELKGFIPKQRFDEVNTSKKELETQLSERDTQLSELNNKVKGNEELEKTIAELQEANTTTKTEYENKIRDIAIKTSIVSKLTDTKYPDLLLGKFDVSKLSVTEDGTVVGVDEQLATIKEQYKDLFTPVVTGRQPSNVGGSATGGKNPFSKEHFNLTEQGRLYRENPELAKQLQNTI